MGIRRYQAGDEIELWNLFFNTVHIVNLQDYTLEQVQAWAPDEMDRERWRARIEGMCPFLCVHDGIIVGYAGLLASGQIDHFYVHHQWQRQGVGKQLLSAIESEAKAQGLSQLTSDVSITARPFFEAQGFVVTAPQEVTRGAVALRNFKMMKRL